MSFKFLFTDIRGFLMHAGRELSLDEVPKRVSISGALIPGWQSDCDSDLELVPEIPSLLADPFDGDHLFFSQPVKPGQPVGSYPADVRAVARRTEAMLKSLSIADEIQVGVELEFNILKSIRFATTAEQNQVELAEEDGWSGNGNIHSSGHRIGHRSMHHMAGPSDQHVQIRREICKVLSQMGIETYHQGHEAGPSQHEIASIQAPLTVTADQLQIRKHVIRTVAQQFDRTATFMPRPIPYAEGNGMHINLSLWKDGRNVFYGGAGQDSRISQMGLAFIAGILLHIQSLNALANPTNNSYKRLNQYYPTTAEPGWGYANRLCAIRIPYFHDEESCRIEIRFPDPSANPYLSLSALVCAGTDGVMRGLQPPGEQIGSPSSHVKLFHAGGAMIGMAPDLRVALNALHVDRDYLTNYGVFSDYLVDSIIQDGSYFWHWAATTPSPMEYQVFYGH